MKKSELAELLTFLAITEQGGIGRAAAHLGVTASAASQALRRLEDRLGVRLLHRTSRRSAPTEAGAALAARLARTFADADEAIAQASSRPSARLRLTVSSVAAEVLVAPHLPGFLARHPGMSVEVSVEDRFVDLAEGRFDAGIRRGHLVVGGMVQRRLTPDTRMLAVASPGYLDGHAPVRHPLDLCKHACIRIRRRTSDALPAWRFSRGEEESHVNVSGPLVVDNPHLALQTALAGAGIAWLAEDFLAPRLRAGGLLPVLSDWAPACPGFFLYQGSLRHAPATLGLLADYLRDAGRDPAVTPRSFTPD